MAAAGKEGESRIGGSFQFSMHMPPDSFALLDLTLEEQAGLDEIMNRFNITKIHFSYTSTGTSERLDHIPVSFHFPVSASTTTGSGSYLPRGMAR